ncbi:factor 13 [Dermatophagoides farinae]|uniref:Factor 13 n=1 Tax=Dermatophagoides farinae TaxID=6954 RepID=A0A922LCM0_DERFA|nr:factor 13 [Dermatophagoides farinae]
MAKIFLNKDNCRLIRVLLQYRHMFLYLLKHYANEIDNFLQDLKDDDFKANLEYCDKIFHEITSTDDDKMNQPDKFIVELIRQTESYYGSHEELINIDLVQKLGLNSKINQQRQRTTQKRKQTDSAPVTSKKKCYQDSEKKENSRNLNSTILNDDDDDLFGLAMKYICSYGCRYRSTSKDKVNKHEQIVHSGQRHKCLQNNCTEQFDSVFDLEKHLKQSHNIFQCSNEKCAIIFRNENELKRHLKMEHLKEYLTCNSCNKNFRNRKAISKHIYLVHDTGHYRCDHDGCDFFTSYRGDLLTHKQSKHMRKKCEFNGCDRYISITYYTRHLRSHQNIRSYQCSWPDCEKSFFDNTSLKDHVRVHLNFKRFRCKWPHCSYACEQKTNLITHIRIRHFKLPHTKKRQLELNISMDSFPNPNEYVETINEDISVNTPTM